ncbi:MAG: hypothetical protein K1X79_00190 [Oligoflexia bacterium]|nr:hypothetical protein [Oligoflexia bacterium]
MNAEQSSNSAEVSPKFNSKLFWFSFVLPTVLIVSGFCFAELVAKLGGPEARFSLESMIGPVWAIGVFLLCVACPLVCAAQCVKFLKSGLAKVVCGLVLSGLLTIVNAVIGVSTCATFNPPNFH